MSNSGYIPKDICFDDEGRKKLIKGIATISKAVKSTLGPRGKTVLIESPQHTNNITITKDGVTVARAIELIDPVENLAIQMMKDAANRTANSAGDGTTTAIVLTEAVIMAGEKYITPEHNITEVVRHINYYTNNTVEMLKKESQKISKRKLLDVATISVNNDKVLGKIIADAYKKVGKDGVVTVERSQTAETYAEVTNGIKINRGYTSNLFINNQKKDECIMEDVNILVCDSEISNILQLENILKHIINKGEKLLIIGTCTTNVINTLAANVVRNGLKFCNILPPQFGYKQHELMQDIALAVGAKYYSEKTGDDLSLMTPHDLGRADKIIVGQDTTVVIKEGEISQEIKQRISELKEQQENTKDPVSKNFINERVASLAGGIGCIYVGGNSDVEQKEKFDRVDDSVCAVRSALQEGIVPGGGLALYKLADEHWVDCGCGQEANANADKNQEAALSILSDALKAPLYQILLNAGLDVGEIMSFEGIDRETFKADNLGYDVKNEKYGDMLKMGIIDPVKVTRHALINAISVATTILSTNAIVTHARKHEEKEA
jgi:chaperonin GroEL